MSDQTPPEAPKPETDFETWWRSLPDGPGYIGRHLAEYAWQAAHTALSARLAEVERERDQLIGKLCLICGAASPCELSTHEMSPCTFDPSPIEAARAFLDRATTAESALATAQGQLAEAEQDCKDWRKQYEAARQETRNLEPYVDRAEAAETKLVDADAVIEEVFGDISAPEDWCVPGKFGSTIQDAIARHKARAAGKGTGS